MQEAGVKDIKMISIRLPQPGTDLIYDMKVCKNVLQGISLFPHIIPSSPRSDWHKY
jgi:hypothetical protein